MGKQITPKQAATLCNNFDTKYQNLCKLINKDDNRSVLFSLEELKQYISYLEDANMDIDGIRVYFGSYANGEGPEKKESDNMSTVFLAPVSNDVDNTKLNVLNWENNGNPPQKKYTL